MVTGFEKKWIIGNLIQINWYYYRKSVLNLDFHHKYVLIFHCPLISSCFHFLLFFTILPVHLVSTNNFLKIFFHSNNLFTWNCFYITQLWTQNISISIGLNAKLTKKTQICSFVEFFFVLQIWLCIWWLSKSVFLLTIWNLALN